MTVVCAGPALIWLPRVCEVIVPIVVREFSDACDIVTASGVEVPAVATTPGSATGLKPPLAIAMR
jgi:hypothetical protein